jgi:hypothetical protein
LHKAAIQAKENLQLKKEETLMVFADKGYHTGVAATFLFKLAAAAYFIKIAIPDKVLKALQVHKEGGLRFCKQC